MDTSKRTKKPPMTFKVVNSEGVSIPKARKPIRIVHWTPT